MPSFVVCLWSQKGNFDASPRLEDIVGLVKRECRFMMSSPNEANDSPVSAVVTVKNRFKCVSLLQFKLKLLCTSKIENHIIGYYL